MAIQVTGPWIIEPSATSMGSDQATSSACVTFSVNQTVTATIPILGRVSASTGLFVEAYATNALHLQEVGASGGTSDVAYIGTLAPNQIYQVAFCWANGTQAIYVNGVEVASGSYSLATDTTTSPLFIGANGTQAGLEVTISEVAIFDGYDLRTVVNGAYDFINLLTGAATPLTTSTKATVYWTLDGPITTPPTAAQVGDAGFANSGTASGSSYNLSSITGAGSAVYVADLEYVVPVSIVAYVTKNGLFAIGTTASATGLPTNITTVTTNPTIYVGGVAQTMYGPVWRDSAKDSPLVFYSFETPVTSSSVVTYTVPFGSITTSAGLCGQVTGASASNYFGTLEATFGGVSSFTPSRQMPLGINIGYYPMVNYFGYNLTRNARLRLGLFGSTTDANLQPLTVPVNTAFSTPYFNITSTNAIEVTSGQVGLPGPIGVHSLVFEDVNANNADALQCWLVGNANTASGIDTSSSGPGNGSGSTFVRSVSGTTVTVSYWVNYTSFPNYTHGYNLDLQWYFKSPLGNWGANDPTSGTPTITNFWAFAPGDSTTTPFADYTGPYPNSTGNDRSDPYAFSSVFLGWLTAGNGNGPACVRLMEPLMFSGTYLNYQTYADVQPPDVWSMAIKPAVYTQCDYVRCYNTNPAKGPSGDNTYGWASTKVYHPLLGFDGNTSSMWQASSTEPSGYYKAPGNYIDLTLRGGNGLTDNGVFMGGNAIEFVTNIPHGYRTGDWTLLSNDSSAPFPFWIAMTPGWGLGGFGESLFGTAPQTTLGSVSVIYGSATVIFASAQTLAKGATLTFDSTGVAYKIVTGGTSQTIYTVFPVFLGTTNATATAVTTPAAGLFGGAGVIVVTSPTSFCYESTDLANATYDSLYPSQMVVVSTSQIPMSSSGTLSGTAATTRLSTSVTTSASQSNQVGMTWTFTGDSGTYTVTACNVAGTVSVTNGSASVTTSASQSSSQVGMTWTIGGGSYVVASGSGTSWTLATNYTGTTNGTATATTSLGTSTQWTISPSCGTTLTAATVTSSMSFGINPIQSGGVMTYGLGAYLSAQWPGCACWIPLGNHMSDACLQAIADEMAPYLLNGATVVAEMGLEHWNFPSFPTGYFNLYYGNLLAYVAAGTVVNSYYTAPGTAGQNSIAINQDQAYVLMAAHKHDVLQAQFDTHAKGIKVVRLFGSQWDEAGHTTAMIQFGREGTGVTQPVPMGAIGIAPYVNAPTDPTYTAAAASVLPGTASATNGSGTVTTSASQSNQVGQTWTFPADSSDGSYVVQSGSGTSWVISPTYGGSTASGLLVESTSQGVWAVTLMHDYYRHFLKYSGQSNGDYPNQLGKISEYYTPLDATSYPGQSAGLPSLYCYECQVQSIDPLDGAALQHDLFYSPAMVDTLNTFLQSLQDGKLALSNIYSMGGYWGGGSNQQLWNLIIYHEQGYGDGSANKFTTPQGGSPGDGKCYDKFNESVELPQVQAWFAVANSAQMATTSIAEKPTRIQPNIGSDGQTLTFTGAGTNWTSDSSVSITNSVTGTTTVTAGTWTATSSILATLTVTTGAGTGTFTVTIDGITSPSIGVGAKKKGWYGGMSRLGRLRAS